jgi:hemoglobin/transferrin/lactoferrin receptor protein
MDHIPPLYGKTSFNYQLPKFSTELSLMYNSWKRLDQMNNSGEDNPQYGTPDGYPAWTVLNWRGNYQISKGLQLQAGIENILDRNYRYFASGFSAGGRNVMIALRANW